MMVRHWFAPLATCRTVFPHRFENEVYISVCQVRGYMFTFNLQLATKLFYVLNAKEIGMNEIQPHQDAFIT